MTSSRVVLLSAAALLLVTGCRDEQAGPKPRAQAAPLQRPAPAPAGMANPVLDAAPANLGFRSGATFGGGAIQYLGSRIEPAQPQPGQPVLVQHFFTALKPPPQGFGFFVHVIDPASGQMLANADHDFANGAMPLANWPVGKVVVDQMQLQTPSQPARIVMGFWQGNSRLPVDQANLQDGQNRVLGPTLGGQQAQPLPEYHVKRTQTAPTIDGDLSDAAWSQAPEVTLVQSFNGSTPDLRTQARLLYDDRFLYVAFDCEDPDVWGTLMNRDDSIYTQEVVEIFLDANADLGTYNELEVSPNNVIFDAYFPARRQGMDLSWDSKMQTAVKVRGTVNNSDDRDQGWSVEMKIPYSTLAVVPNTPPKPGDRWRFNLYRLDLPDHRTQHGQAFSPLFIGDFHALPRFGWLQFE